MKMMSVVGTSFGIGVLALAYLFDMVCAAGVEQDRGPLRPEEYPTEDEILACNNKSTDWEILDHDCYGSTLVGEDGAVAVVDPYEYAGLDE